MSQPIKTPAPSASHQSNMNDQAMLFHATQKLKPLERLQLVELILADLDQPDAQIDNLWAMEAQRRWEAYQRGEHATVAHSEVMEKYQSV